MTVDADLVKLTQREREVLVLVAQGLTDQAIGSALGLTRRTVNCHVMNLMRKMGVHNRVTAVVQGIRYGWIPL